VKIEKKEKLRTGLNCTEAPKRWV